MKYGLLHHKSYCGGNSQVPRGGQISWSPSTSFYNPAVHIPEEVKEPLISTNCTTNEKTKIEISYTIYASQTTCKPGGSVERDDELEFSIRFLSNPSEWIPLSYTIINGSPKTICRRGYCVNDTASLNSNSDSMPYARRNVQICGFSVNDSIQVRWLMSSLISVANISAEDRWSLDDIEVSLITEKYTKTLTADTFDMPLLNTQHWNNTNIRNGEISTVCSIGSNNPALVFGKGINNVPYNRFLVSHSALTNIMPLSNDASAFHPITQSMFPPADGFSSCTTLFFITADDEFTTIKSITEADTTILDNIAVEILQLETEIENTFPQTISKVFNSSNVDEQLSQLLSLSMTMTDGNLVLVYILNIILSTLTSFTCDIEIIQMVTDIGGDIIEHQTIYSHSNESLINDVIGSTLLLSLDNLIICEEDTMYSTRNLIGVQVFSKYLSNIMTFIDTSEFDNWTSPFISGRLQLGDISEPGNVTVRILVTVYRNVSSLLPAGNDGSPIVSDVIGISLQCNDCTKDLNLNSIILTFNHSTLLMRDLRRHDSLSTLCVFLDGLQSSNILRRGQWSTRGCTTVHSSVTSTTCECNHLTHFAILLTSKPMKTSNGNLQLSLNFIGTIGTSISVVSMVATITIFIVIKSLRSLRGFIHIHLCISLSIAQIIYVAGIDKTGSDTVPIHCQVTAALLHYFFLVSFMWMLMEGVFLYLALVKVFITNTKKYAIVFTTISYGLPLLYMGLLALPLGFGLLKNQYGYNEACFLKTENHFIWSFIAPVILILICNSVLLIMAAIIMWKQQRKRSMKINFNQILKWIKAVASLTVVMGLTWIIGVFIVEREELLPLVYIYTFMVAFQGFFIFLVLVVFTTSVRDEVRQWAVSKWRKLHTKSYYSTNTMTLSNPSVKDMLPEDLTTSLKAKE